MTSELNILFVGDNSVFSDIAYRCVQNVCPSTRGVFWEHGDTVPPPLDDWRGEWIISFKSDLVLSSNVLGRASKAAINFHPSTPKYRGIGGYSWAIHNSDTTYGVTCHHMVETIDFGPIIAVRCFPILQGETPDSLKMRSGVYCLYLLNELLPLIIGGEQLPLAQESWGKKLYTYADLEALAGLY